MNPQITTPRKRRTTTEKQLETLTALPQDLLVPRALEAMHCLNRRAKEKRDRASDFSRMRFAEAIREEVAEIYRLKERFLAALVNAGLTQVQTFVERREAGWECTTCGHSWGGHREDCFRCGGVGEPEYDDVTWCIVECRGYRFHTPKPTTTMLTIAVEIEPHDPTQPQRKIPDVGLTIAAQMECVVMATAQLNAQPKMAGGE